MNDVWKMVSATLIALLVGGFGGKVLTEKQLDSAIVSFDGRMNDFKKAMDDFKDVNEAVVRIDATLKAVDLPKMVEVQQDHETKIAVLISTIKNLGG